MRRKYIEVDGWRIGTEIRMIKCGKKNCRCATNDEHRHPYYVATKTDSMSGKTIKHYFKELPTVVVREILRMREFYDDETIKRKVTLSERQYRRARIRMKIADELDRVSFSYE